MKKLNITKERFEKSRYFTKKYGKLEYVSESGKLFKTSKGKVLKFNESADFDDEGHLDADEDNPKFSIGDKVIWNDSLWKVVDCWYDSIEGSNLYDLKGLDTREETSDVPGDELCAHDGGIAYESTKKFGRKFNERTRFMNTSDVESVIFAALNKVGGVIRVERTDNGYILETKDDDFKIDLNIEKIDDSYMNESRSVIDSNAGDGDYAKSDAVKVADKNNAKSIRTKDERYIAEKEVM